MTERRTLLVGSIPADNAEQAMSEALREVGGHLDYLPDGETGDRDTWVVGMIKSFRSHPDLEVKREGDWSNYKSQLNFKVKKGRRLTGDSLQLGLADAFRDSYPAFQRLRSAGGKPDLAFLVGVPGAFDLTLFTFGPAAAFLRRGPVTDALAREMREIHDEAGDAVLFQIEIPVEQVFVAQMPKPVRRLMAAVMAGKVIEMVRRAPAGSRIGIHLCFGDLGHRALGKVSDAGPLTTLTNAIVRRWPAQWKLEYVHAPLAAGEAPPVLDPAFYRPLARLRLPDGVRFVAGFQHEDCSLEDAQRILGWVESQIGRPVDVAASCGLGRRGQQAAQTIMRQSAKLCEPTTAPQA